MTRRVNVTAPNGSSMQARALLDSASSTSFISERLAQGLHLTHSRQAAHILGVAGLSHKLHTQSVVTFHASSVHSQSKQIDVTAIVVSKVTCHLPLPFDPRWKHLSGLQLADPEFDVPDRIDVLLGVDVFAEVLQQGWRNGGIPGSPTDVETTFSWVLAGRPKAIVSTNYVVTLHTSLLSADDVLHRFWEVEEHKMTNQY